MYKLLILNAIIYNGVFNNRRFCFSRAIIVYLVQAYGKDDSLFPKDPKKQAVVNQRLQFDVSTLYPAFSDQYVSIYIFIL